MEGDGFEPSVPREGLAEDRDDGSPFRGRQRRKIPAEESSESAVQMNMRGLAITRANVVIRTSVLILLSSKVRAADTELHNRADFELSAGLRGTTA